jgi:hypothetical protein
MNNEIALITWTHTEYDDIWPMYFGRLNKHIQFNKSYIFVNQETDNVPTSHIQLTNNDTDPYYKRFLECLRKVEEEYVLYMQEDHIFYDNCNELELERVFQYLKSSRYSNIRLIKSGELGGKEVEKNIIDIPNNSQYLFSQQSAIWKKEDLINLISFYKPTTYRDVELYGSIAMKSQNLKSCYYYNNEKMRGNMHCDSSILPYIATAVCKGQWNLFQYPALLQSALDEYQVDFSIRGLYRG